MVKRVIKIVCIFSAVLTAILYSSFSVSADYDIQETLLSNSNYLAYQYWFNQGLTNYIVRNGNNTTTTYSGNLVSNNITGQLGGTTFGSNIIGWRNTSDRSYFVNSVTDTVQRPLTLTSGNQSIGINPINFALNGMTSTEPNTMKSVFSTGFLTGYETISSYNSNRAITFTSNTDTYIAFACDVANITVNDLQLLSSSSNVSNITITRVSANPSAVPFRQYIFKFSNSGSAVNVAINWKLFNSSTKIRPIYNGTLAYMPNEIREVLGMETREEIKLNSIDNKFTSLLNILNHGNSTTNNSVSSNDSTTNNMVSAENNFHNQELTAFENVDNQLDSIGTTNNLYQNNGFISATNFIRTQFTELIILDSSRSLELLIVFSLILGIALTVIGKLRN